MQPPAWSTDPLLQHQWFSSVMSLNQLNKHIFHCAGSADSIPQGEEGHDPLNKGIETLTIIFKTHYKAACELTIDDSMVGTKCRVTFLQYTYFPRETPQMYVSKSVCWCSHCFWNSIIHLNQERMMTVAGNAWPPFSYDAITGLRIWESARKLLCY